MALSLRASEKMDKDEKMFMQAYHRGSNGFISIHDTQLFTGCSKGESMKGS